MAVCVHFDLEDAELRDFFSENSSNISAIVPVGARRITVQRIIDLGRTSAHFHVEATVKSGIWHATDAHTGDPKEILRIPDELAGRTFLATVWARRKARRVDLDPKGIIAALAGVTATEGSYRVFLTGGSADLRGDGPLIQLRWWDLDDEEFTVEIGAYATVTIDDTLFQQASKIVKPGFSHFISRASDVSVAFRARRKKKRKKNGSTDI